jgi:hypothetical protein
MKEGNTNQISRRETYETEINGRAALGTGVPRLQNQSTCGSTQLPSEV